MKLGAVSKGLAVAAMASLSLAACSAQTEIVENTTITAAWNQPLYSFNQNTSSGNATANANVLYMTQQSFNYYNDAQELIRNPEFGTYDLISEDPLTIKYTITDGVTWSDGVAVDAADLLFNWASLSGNFNEGDPEYDEETGVLVPTSNVFFDSVAIGGGIEKVTQTPVIGDDGRSITLVYDEILVDWELLFTSVGVPAHVVAMNALDIEDAKDAKQAVIDGINNADASVLQPLSVFWSIGFDAVEMPEDESILVGNGAYVVTDFVKDEYITLEARGADYKAGPQPKVENITVRFIPDALASVQALQNGEVDITLPQATTDVLEAALLIDGITVLNEPEAVYEHIDLVFNGDGAFGAAYWGGDEAMALATRRAFLTAIDVEEVLDRLIRPLQPNAAWDQSQMFLPGAPGYDDSIANNGSAAYGQGDEVAAMAILADAGIEGDIEVRMLFSSTNTRRANEYQLYAEQVAEAGFTLVDISSESWGSLLGSGTYDLSLFGWQSTSTAVTASEAIFRTDGGSNFTGYGNPAADKLWDELKVTFDKDRQIAILQEIDKIAWEDGYGMTVFQFPGVTLYNSELSNISSSPLSPQFFWNYWEWEAPVAE